MCQMNSKNSRFLCSVTKYLETAHPSQTGFCFFLDVPPTSLCGSPVFYHFIDILMQVPSAFSTDPTLCNFLVLR